MAEYLGTDGFLGRFNWFLIKDDIDKIYAYMVTD